jgi:hypothetical protein
MNRALSLLASLLASFTVAAAPMPAQAPAQQWGLLGSSEHAVYHLHVPSMKPDTETLSVSFILRTTYKEDQASGANGKKMRAMTEHTLVLCKDSVMITMSQVQYDATGARIGAIIEPTVYYESQDEPGGVITSIISQICRPAGAPQSTPQRDEPSRKQRGGNEA